MKNKKTYYQLILDKSGSMESCKEQTISGFNEQIQSIKNLTEKFPEQELKAGLVTFNSHIYQDFKMTFPERIPKLNNQNYQPDACTALLDAIGDTIYKLKQEIKYEIKEGIASVVVVIITDGHENASKTYSSKEIRNLIKELEATDFWSFSFMGANSDALEVAESLNIRKSNAITYKTTEIKKEFHNIADSMEEYLNAKRSFRINKNFLRK